MSKTSIVVVGTLLIVCAMRAVTAQDVTPYPGLPTQGKVWIQNRGEAEAIPVTLQGGPATEPLRVLVVGTPPVTIGGANLLPVRHSRQQWEYRSIPVPRGEDPALLLNSAGADGWEAVGLTVEGQDRTTMVMKRPK